jgi:NAD(P)H dehydrogenase (quinone)
MILITGSTGQLGKSTIEFLLKKLPASQIAALARDEEKAGSLKEKGIEVRKGDYDDKASLVSAFKGIDKLFFVSGSDVFKRMQQHKNVVEAAKEAGVKHIIYTSFSRKNETESNPLGIIAKSHIETDKIIRESGISFTILLNGLYADVLPMFFGEKVFETGIFLPAGDGKAAYVSRNDIAEAAANIISTPGHEGNEYVLANSENYSLQTAAELLASLSGKPVSYQQPDAKEYRAVLTNAGVPAEFISLMADFSEAIKQGEFETNHSDMEELLGRKPASLKEFFQQAYFSKN